MKKRSPLWLLWMLGFLLLAWWLFLAKDTSVHPLKAFPPYLSEVSIFPLNRMDDQLNLPLANQPLTTDLNLLEQAIAFWVDTGLSFDSTLYYAFDRNNPGSLATLMAVRVFSKGERPESWMGFIPADQRSQHKYRGTSVMHYEQKGAASWYFALVRGLLLASTDQKQVERSIALMDEKAPNLYVYFKRKGELKKSDPIQVLFNTGNPTAPSWNRLDWHIDSLWGKDIAEDDVFQQHLLAQAPVNFSQILPILPDRSFLLDMISIQDASLFFDRGKGLGPQFWTSRLQALLGRQLAYVVEEGGRAEDAVSFLIVSLADEIEAGKALEELTDQNGLLERYDYQAHRIIHTLAENVSAPFFGDRYPDIQNPYWTIIDGFLICSSDADRLKLWVDYLVLQNNLAQSEVMVPFFPMIQDECQRMVLWRSPYNKEIPSSSDHWWHQWTSTYSAGLISWKDQAKNWIVRGKLYSSSLKEKLADISWRKDLFQSLEYGPRLVKHPLINEAYGISIQGSDHLLQIFSPEGSLRWTMQLDGPILGDIQTFQINPTEWGLLFNTSGKIYKTDAQGQLLSDWDLRVPAIQGLRMVVFEEPGDPHFFLPAANQGIYGYNILGDALINWNPCPTNSDFLSSVFHMASSTTDHLLWLDQSGQIHAKYRDGREVQGLPSSVQSLFFSEKNRLTYILRDNGSIGRLTTDLKYRELVKSDQKAIAFSWIKKSGKLFLLKKDQQGIHRFQLEGSAAQKQSSIAYPAGNHRFGLLENDGRWQTIVQDEKKQRLEMLNDQGDRLYSEFIPCDGEYMIFQWQGETFMATAMGEELVVYRI